MGAHRRAPKSLRSGAQRAAPQVAMARARWGRCGDQMGANGVARMRSLDGVAVWLMVLSRPRIWVGVNGLEEAELGIVKVCVEEKLIIRRGVSIVRGLDDGRGLIIVRGQERGHMAPKVSLVL